MVRSRSAVQFRSTAPDIEKERPDMPGCFFKQKPGTCPGIFVTLTDLLDFRSFVRRCLFRRLETFAYSPYLILSKFYNCCR
jgi:hypothetical protein